METHSNQQPLFSSSFLSPPGAVSASTMKHSPLQSSSLPQSGVEIAVKAEKELPPTLVASLTSTVGGSVTRNGDDDQRISGRPQPLIQTWRKDRLSNRNIGQIKPDTNTNHGTRIREKLYVNLGQFNAINNTLSHSAL